MHHTAQTMTITGPITAYVSTDEGARIVRELAANLGTDEPVLYGGGVSGAARVADQLDPRCLLMTEMGNLPLEIAAESIAEIHRVGAKLIVFGHHDDITTYRTVIAAGAMDYFAFPVTATEILHALRSQDTANDPMPMIDPSLRIGVTGSNGGVGASVLAQNIAFLAASMKKAPRMTALIDADLRFGSAACDLNKNATPGLLEALQAPARVDETFLKSTMDQLGEMLFLYSDHVQRSADADIAEEGFADLVSSISLHFEATVLDAPRDLLMRRPEVLQSLKTLIVVVPSGYSGIHAATSLIAAARAEAPDLSVIPVLGELRKDAGLTRNDLSKALGENVRHVLPRADQMMQRALRAGSPVTMRQPGSPYARAVRTLWAEISAQERSVKSTSAPQRAGLLRRMLG